MSEAVKQQARRRIISLAHALKQCDRESDERQWIDLNSELAAEYLILHEARGKGPVVPGDHAIADKVIFHVKQADIRNDHESKAAKFAILAGIHRSYPHTNSEMKAQHEELAIESFTKAIEHMEKLISEAHDIETRVEWWSRAAHTSIQLALVYISFVSVNNVVNSRTNGTEPENIALAIQSARKGLSYGSKDVRKKWPQQFKETAVSTCQLLASLFTVNSQKYASSTSRAEDQENAIMYCGLGTKGLDKHDRNWAITQLRLGVLMSEREEGDVRLNLELSLVALRKCLKVFQSQPLNPTTIMKVFKCLGNVYRWRIGGDRSANLELSVEYYKKAISHIPTIVKADTQKEIFEIAKVNTQKEIFEITTGFSKTCVERIEGTRDDSLSEAIEMLGMCIGLLLEVNAGHSDDEIRLKNLSMAYRQQAMMYFGRCLDRGGLDTCAGTSDLSLARQTAEAAQLDGRTDMCSVEKAQVYAIIAVTARGHRSIVLHDDRSDPDGKERAWSNGVRDMYRTALAFYDTEVSNETSDDCENGGCCLFARTRQERMEYELIKNRFLIDYAMMGLRSGCQTDANALEDTIELFQRALLFFKVDEYAYQFGIIHSQLAMSYLRRVEGKLRDNVELSARSYDICMGLSCFDENIFPVNWESDNMKIGAEDRRRKAAEQNTMAHAGGAGGGAV